MSKEIKMFAHSESALCSNASLKLLPRLQPALLSLLLASCFIPAIVDANPVTPQVINGKVIFNKNGNLFTITNTPGAIINWQDFSIDSGEITRFIQESANSTVLNRVVGQNPSQILGALQSNGRVFLINPNGVLFGKGAQVDVNGLTVSSLGMSDADFKAGKLNFDAGTQAGKVSNQGAITTPAGGHVYLIAPDIENSGIITAPNGEVLLAAGRSVKLVDSANPDVQVVVSADSNQAVNLGQVISQGGKIGIYGALITQRGLVSADSAVVGANGKIYFKASQDTILDTGSRTSATGAGLGGDISILGQRVGMAGNAQVDASGTTGGGQVLLGGDYHGDNPSVPNAKRSFVSSDASLRADATQTGNGGKVVVWSDEVTRVNGSISARGGLLGGNGGFVETSGKQSLDFNAQVDTSAARGKNGTLLLDPASITITGGGVGGNFQGSTVIGTINFADAGPTTVSQNQIQGLAGGTNIVLEATNYIDTSGVFASSQINLPLNSSLTLRTRNSSTDVSATRGINLVSADPNLAFNATGAGTITLQTGTGTSAQTADIQIAKLTTQGRAINISSSGKASFDTLLTTPPGGNGGDVTVTSLGGPIISGNGAIDARPGSVFSAGNVTLSSGLDIMEKNGTTFYANNLKMTAGSGIHGTLSTDNLVVQASQLNALNTGSGDIRIQSTGTILSVNDIGATGYGVKQQATGAGVYLSSPSGQAIEIHAPVLSNNGLLSMTGAGGINQYATGNISSAGGNISLATTDADVLLSSAAGAQVNSAGGAIALKSDKMQLLGTINAGSNAVSIDGNASVTINLAAAHTATSATLELPASELNGITATRLRIGSAATSNISINGPLNSGSGGALQNINTSLTLKASNNITQQSGAIIDGASSLQVQAYTVSLAEANTIGVISGSGGSTSSFTYRSVSPINISTVDGLSGISGGSIVSLQSDSTSGISQAAGNSIIGSSLALKSKGNVSLTNTSNSFSSLAADLNVGGLGTGSLTLFNAGNLTISNLSGISGITTNNQRVDLITGSGSTLIVSNTANPINAGTSKVGIVTDNLNLGGGIGTEITAGEVGIRPFTTGRAITVGAAVCTVAPCLTVNSLYKINAGSIGLGSDSGADGVGPISVVGVTDTNTNTITDIAHGVTTRIGLLSGGNITQTNGITVQDLGLYSGAGITLNSVNTITNLAARSVAGLSLVNSQGLNISSLTGGSSANPYSLSGITAAGNISLTANSGNIAINSSILATNGGAVTISATGGAINQVGSTITASGLNVTAGGGIGNTSPLLTLVPVLTANNSGANSDINIYNTGALNIQSVQQTTPGSTGNIMIDNGGPITLNNTDSVRTMAGNISLVAHSPLTVNGTVASTNNGNITLEAGATGSTADKLTVGTSGVVSTGGNILLKAGDAIVISGTVNGGTVSKKDFLNSANPSSSVLPTLSQCISNPSLSGCNLVLPSVSSCISDSLIPGCSVVLPSLASCISNPSLSGCSAVLPSLTSCIANISLAGCSAVLPSLSSCIANPSLQGCSVVLPSAAVCQSAPTTPGCTISLPSLSTCMANPTLANCSKVLPSVATCLVHPDVQGCTVVLPSLSACLSNPSLFDCNYVLPSFSSCLDNPAQSGCNVVLPNLSQCIARPQVAGCSVVLPSIEACIASPNTPGCSVVLPSLAACIANPAQTGCSNTLPSIAACISNSNLAGCSAVLPTFAACTATPTLPGCSVILPTLATCITAPSTAGCSSVLPSLTACLASPSLPGCTAVLPTFSACVANPALPGCSSVLPTLAACIATPALAGCSAVLPTLSACTSNPNLPGCQAILPTLIACSANPGLAGCSAVLPGIATCIATPTLAGCNAVLPTLAVCIASPSLPGCSVVLPSLASCIANPGLPACSAVLPGLAACTTAPTTPGCSAVLPSLATCTANPAQTGCSAVLPSLATCAATPATAGCSAVLPSLTVCIANPALPGCSAVLPTLASCIVTPSTAGCSAVLPSLASCVANPATQGCSAVLPTLASCAANPALKGCSAILPSQAACANQPGLLGCTLVLPIGDLRTSDPLTNTINAALNSVISSTLFVTNSITNSSYFFEAGASDSGRETKFEQRSSFASGRDNGVLKNASDKKLYCN